jgi:hypothetical protein
MTPRDPTPWLVAAILASVGAMVVIAMRGRVGLIVLPAALFTLATALAAYLSNAADWRPRAAPAGTAEVEAALYRNARTLGAAYAWAALAMQCLYLTPITGLRWQHGWQYATVFALLAVLAYEFARQLAVAEADLRAVLVRTAVPVTIAQGVLAAGGLAFLTLSGKVVTRRPDWAANQVFLFAALAVMVLAAITLRTHARLTQH